MARLYSRKRYIFLSLSLLQTIKSQHIATVRRLPSPPHLIMRIMDCVLLLFRKKIDTVVYDPDRNCSKPSWAESLKVRVLGLIFEKDYLVRVRIYMLNEFMLNIDLA